jgi:transcriptional regulator with XRE-family HTH domain
MKQHESLLRIARLKKCWTPEFVSEKVGVTLNTYNRWESGMQIPRISSIYALSQIFEMTPSELGFTPEVLHSRRYPSSHDAQQRDETSQSNGKGEDEEEPSSPEEPTMYEEALSLWTMGMDSCWDLYMVGGQDELERLLPNYLANLTRPTLSPGPEQKIAATLTAQVYQLTALLELQRGDFISAQVNGTQALVYSQLAKDWNIYIASQIRLASIFTARKRVGSALSSYNEALRRVNTSSDMISPLLHSWIFAGLAEIQATMGREKEAMQFLRLSFAVFPDEPASDPCFTYTHFDHSLLFLYEGLVFLRLGKAKLAWDAFSQVDDVKPPPPARIRADFLKHRTYTSLVLGNMIQSCIYLEAAAKAAQEINSDLAFSEIYTLYEHMLSLWGQEVRVRSLAKLFQK